MKKMIFIAIFSLFLFGCNMNPSKEARIQKLETEAQQTTDKINELENSVQTLVIENNKLKARILEFEEQ